jgi:pyruvate/2-oxoglutarate dehydrogenase complex dihydrolipoamide acyltransferase (E2) component
MQITEKGETFPYRYLAMPLSTEDERRRAITYMLMFRSMNDDKFMQKYGLEKGFGVKRAMIFDRPPVLTNLFRDLGLPIPALFRDGLGRASRIHKENTATAPSGATAAAPAPSAPSGATAASPAPRTAAPPAPKTAAPPAAQPRTPPLPPTPALPKGIVAARQSMREGMTVNDIIGGYGKPINPFGLSVEEQGELVKESQASTTPPGAPDSPPYRPSTPLRGGTRSKKVVKRGTRRVKTVEHLAKAFSKVWAKLGKK